MASEDGTQQKDGFEIPHEKSTSYWKTQRFVPLWYATFLKVQIFLEILKVVFSSLNLTYQKPGKLKCVLDLRKKKWQFKSYIFNKITWQQIKFNFCLLQQKIGYFFSFLGHSTLFSAVDSKRRISRHLGLNDFCHDNIRASMSLNLQAIRKMFFE